MTTEVPAPLVPADCDLRDFAFMPLDVLRLRDSDLVCVEDAEVFRCAVLSWCVAWHQIPAASLPDDDILLARLFGFGRDVKEWKRVRAAGGMRGWKRCEDGRLYHPVVAEKARDAPHLERREGDESLYLYAPTFQLPANQAGVPDWLGQSLYGGVNKDGTQLKLQGPVDMNRAAFGDTPATRIQTADVTAWPKQNRLATAAPAQMVQGGTRISGIGMRADLNDKHLELLDDVHATFPPRQR